MMSNVFIGYNLISWFAPGWARGEKKGGREKKYEEEGEEVEEEEEKVEGEVGQEEEMVLKKARGERQGW